MTDIPFIIPDWPAPAHVHAICSTRTGGISTAPWTSLNLGDHVGDAPAKVTRNRNILSHAANLPTDPLWLTQVHGTRVINSLDWHAGIEADAIFSQQHNHVCTIMTADCLPILLCDQSGQQVAAIHAGWRGLAAGIIEATVQQFSAPSQHILAWLGPAIGPTKFEVGTEVREAFINVDKKADEAFTQTDPQHYLADIYQLARQRLQTLGIDKIYGGEFCTMTDEHRFFSFRRDGQTGRMASIIWLSPK